MPSDSLSTAEASLTAGTAPSLGTAASFGALGGAGVTCTTPNPPLPAITVTGNVGSALAAPTSVTGFPGFTPGANRCSLSGTVQLGAAAAFADFNTAYSTLAGIPCPTDAAHNLVGDLGGKNLAPGTYCFSGVALLTSQLTLTGPADGVWIFKGTSITPIGGSVVMGGLGSACNVYWQLGTTAVINNAHFIGNVLAGSAVTFTGTNSGLIGRALAKTNVTLTGANISACAAGANGGGGAGGGGNDCDGKGQRKCKCRGKDRDHDDGRFDRDHQKRGHGEDCRDNGDDGDRDHDRNDDD